MSDDIIKALDDKMKHTLDNLKREFGGLRTNRAHPSLLDHIKVNVYGQSMQLNGVATINASDARTLLVNVWDANNVKSVDSAIRGSDLGVNPRVDGSSIYISLPELTEERRQEMVKIIRKKAEEAKIALRNIRRDFNEDCKKKQKEKDLTEDDLKELLDKIQKETDNFSHLIDETTENKIKDTTTV